MEFKVGDRVLVVKNVYDITLPIGSVLTVAEVTLAAPHRPYFVEIRVVTEDLRVFIFYSHEVKNITSFTELEKLIYDVT